MSGRAFAAVLAILTAAPLWAGDRPPGDGDMPWLDEVRAQRHAWERAMAEHALSGDSWGLSEESRKRRQALREDYIRRHEALEKRHREWEAEQERRHQWWLRQTAPPGWNNLWYYRGY